MLHKIYIIKIETYMSYNIVNIILIETFWTQSMA